MQRRRTPVGVATVQAQVVARLAAEALPDRGTGPLDLEAFLSLSEVATGRRGLDQGLGRRVLAAMEATGHGKGLAALYRGEEAPRAMRALLQGWFLGRIGDRGGWVVTAPAGGAEPLARSCAGGLRAVGGCEGEAGMGLKVHERVRG
jgi:hypothetical protein